MELFRHYFPQLKADQLHKLDNLPGFYEEWNRKINLVSRKDIDNLRVRHVLHSLSIAGFFSFKDGTNILDVGTGGGFPGIPLAVFFPEVHFHLIDATAKKIKVVAALTEQFALDNVSYEQVRAENHRGKYDFIISRAVAGFGQFYQWVHKNIAPNHAHDFPNGIIYLKGGDVSEELASFSGRVQVYSLTELFQEPFFETKKMIYLPVA